MRVILLRKFMATAAHIHRFSEMHQTGLPFDAFFRWCHQHPTLNKVIEVAAFFLGACLLTAGLSLKLWGFTLIGGVFCLISVVAWRCLQVFAPSRYDISEPAFCPAQCDGGELYYHGDLPILKIDGSDPHRAGFAQGYLLGAAIQQIVSFVGGLLDTVAQGSVNEGLERDLDGLRRTIPPDYLREMEGLVEGYNQWLREQGGWFQQREITVDGVLLLHLLPDVHNLLSSPLVALLSNWQGMACSSFLDRDPQRGVVFGRTLDWGSWDLLGKYSFVKYIDKGDVQTVEMAIPLIVGTLTGMNHHGFALASNTCAGQRSSVGIGMPSLFYNRHCLERCRSVSDMDAIEGRPLCAYHLILADGANGLSRHFHQDQTRRVLNEEERPLATFNRSFSNRYRYFDRNHSSDRESIHDQFYRNTEALDRERLMESVLRLPRINNRETMQAVLMIPRERRMRVAFDNAFAADNPWIEVPVEDLFSQGAQEGRLAASQ